MKFLVFPNFLKTRYFKVDQDVCHTDLYGIETCFIILIICWSFIKMYQCMTSTQKRCSMIANDIPNVTFHKRRYDVEVKNYKSLCNLLNKTFFTKNIHGMIANKTFLPGNIAIKKILSKQ